MEQITAVIMAKIALPDGKSVSVDQDDFRKLNKYKWGLTNGYPTRMTRVGDRQKKIRLHREVLGHPNGDVDVDHIDRDKLNARKKNLRIVTKSENSVNRSGWGKVGSKNVRIKNGSFVAEVRRGGKLNHLGYFKTKAQAEAAVKGFIQAH